MHVHLGVYACVYVGAGAYAYVYVYTHTYVHAYVHTYAYCHLSKLGWQTDPVAGVTPVLIPQ